MNKKTIIYASIFAFVALFASIIAFWNFQEKKEEMVLGEHTFENTRNNIQRLNHIQMVTPQGGEINIVRHGDIWRFQEAADYFCNVEMLAQFYRMVNDSTIVGVYKGNESLFAANKLAEPNLAKPNEQTQGTRVIIFDEEEQVLDDIIIGARVGKENLFSARKTKGSYMYLVSSIGDFSGEPYAWIPYPLLKIEESQISGLTIGNKYFAKQDLLKIILHARWLQQVLRAVTYVPYGSIITKEDFFAQNTDVSAKTVKVETVSGLVYVFNIYEVGGTYWLQVELTTTKIPLKGIIEFVDNNQQYFSNWLFQITIEAGKALYEADNMQKKLMKSVKK